MSVQALPGRPNLPTPKKPTLERRSRFHQGKSETRVRHHEWHRKSVIAMEGKASTHVASNTARAAPLMEGMVIRKRVQRLWDRTIPDMSGKLALNAGPISEYQVTSKEGIFFKETGSNKGQ
jgi:hypothetical protein